MARRRQTAGCVLSVKPNEYFFAFFYPHEYDSKFPNVAQAFADFGVIELKGLEEPKVVVKPEIAMSKTSFHACRSKVVATLAHLNGLAVQLPLDELIAYPMDDAQFQQILTVTGGSLIMDDVVPPKKGEKDTPPRYRLVRVDPGKGDVAHLTQMRAMLGDKEPLLVSNPDLLKLYALTSSSNWMATWLAPTRASNTWGLPRLGTEQRPRPSMP